MQPRRLQNAFFIGLLVVATLAFLGLIQDFLQPVFWATVLATLFQPVQRWWERTLSGWRSVAAVLSLLTIIVIVLLPLFLVSLAVANEAATLYNRIAAGDIDLQAVVTYIEDMVPVATDLLDRFGLTVDDLRARLSNTAVTASRTLASQAWAFGQNAAQFAVKLSLMLYLVFFFLRDGKALLQAIEQVLPLGETRGMQLFSKFAEVAQATIKGTLVVGIVQGSLGGLIFALLGIEGAVLWGVVMTVLSFLPAVGAAIVWAPAAAVLIITGALWKGVALVVFGAVIIGLADNLLRPLLVGRDTQMPDYLVLLATLGGLTLFGLSGFVIGPIIAALFLTVWQMFGQEFGTTPQDGETAQDGETTSTDAAPPSAEAPDDAATDPSPPSSESPVSPGAS
jgi:predicted PurR-regulated permease PerM